MWKQRLITAGLLTLLMASAWAFERPIPPMAKRGTMTMGAFPEIELNGKARRLSAGGRIFNQQNLIQMPSSITGSNILVKYTEDIQGDIDRVWILTDKEAAQRPAQQRINQAPPQQTAPQGN